MPRAFALFTTARPMLPRPIDAHSSARDFTHSRQFVPQNLLPPNMLLLQTHRAWNFLGQREDEGDDVLGDHRPVHFARVGENNVAIDEFREISADEQPPPESESSAVSSPPRSAQGGSTRP